MLLFFSIKRGAGKSTFLKSLAKELAPLHGEIEWGYQVSAAYYAQHVPERLQPDHTVQAALAEAAHKDIRPQEILDLAGSLLFSGDQVKKKVRVLSGGEKARVALGRILLQRAPLLLLDEPTNHLDFYTVEALTQALEKYEGTVVVVSHDRGFVRRIANKILEVRNGELRLYHGSYDDYVWSVQNYQHALEEEEKKNYPPRRSTPPAPAVSATPKAAPAFDREKKKHLEAEKRRLDKAIEDADRKTKILQSRMAEQSEKLSSVTGTDAANLARELSAAQRKIQELEDQSLEYLSERESVLAALTEMKSS